MLARHILAYLPSLIIPAVVSFAAIYCFTHLLSPSEYGYYTLAINLMTLINAVCFYWLQVALPRLMPQAMKEGTETELRVTTYMAFAFTAAILIILWLFVLGFVPLGDWRVVAILVMPLALARALITMNQALHRIMFSVKRYNFIECGQAVFGLIAGLALILVLHMRQSGAILGLIIGMALVAFVDLPMLLAIRPSRFNKKILHEIMRFGLPLVLAYGFSIINSTSDRFLIKYFYGAGDVGIYAAGYSVMDRISQMIFLIIAMPSFPLTIRRFEQEGVEAARQQTYINGVAALGLALPACAGLILTNHQIANMLIGAEFREGALRVMPWIAVSGVLAGLSTHYFDHAFHLGKKSYLLFFTQGPAALFNVLLNLILIPRLGYIGAAYSTLASYALLLTLSICVGRRAFRVMFPFRPLLQIALATGAMSLALSLIPFPPGALGLTLMMITGGVTYAAAILALNVAGARNKARQFLHALGAAR